MKEETKMEKAFSPEAKAEDVANFAEALNRDDLDGFVYGVSYGKGNLSVGFFGTKASLTFILSRLFAKSRLDPNIFMKAALMHALIISEEGKEDDND